MKDERYWSVKKGSGIVNVPPIDELCEALRRKFEDKEERIKYLKDELEKLKSEKWKDKELQNMKKKLNKMEKAYYRGFPISEKEEKDIQNWISNHESEYHQPKETLLGKFRGGTIGGCYSYYFTPTSIGTVGTIRCNCGKEFTFQEL